MWLTDRATRRSNRPRRPRPTPRPAEASVPGCNTRVTHEHAPIRDPRKRLDRNRGSGSRNGAKRSGNTVSGKRCQSRRRGALPVGHVARQCLVEPLGRRMHDSSSRSCSISCRVSSPTPSARQFIDNELDIVSLVEPLGRQEHDRSSIVLESVKRRSSLGRREARQFVDNLLEILSRRSSRTTRARQFVDTCSTSCLVDPLARRDGDRGSSASTVNGPFVPIECAGKLVP